MGTDVFDPDNETVPDFCRDVLGWQTATPESPEADLAGGKTVLAFVMGAFFGLAIGYTLGTFGDPLFFFKLWR